MEATRIEAGSGPEGGISREAARRAAETLAAGGILVHPTCTTYGIGAGSAGLDAEIARLKGRPAERRFIRIGADVEALRRTHPELVWDERARTLAREFWPGPLTLVLAAERGESLAVRVEAHPATRAVLEEWGGTVSSTSLNRSGEPPARDPEGVKAALERMPGSEAEAAWLDAGPLPPSPASTILSLREARPVLLRGGAVGEERLAECLGGAVARGEP